MFANERLEFLRHYLPFKNGISRKNTDSRAQVMAALDPKLFQNCFCNGVKSFQTAISQIAIDGKTLRQSHNRPSEQKAIHLVSVFATEARLVLAQEKTEDKSNEITPIPKLLDQLCLKDTLVSIDAMGCQKKIAKNISRQQADSIFSLKSNQSTLHEEVALFLDTAINKQKSQSSLPFYEEVDKGQGRRERRTYWMTSAIDWLEGKGQWEGFRSMAAVDSHREIQGKLSRECRYFVTSLAG